MQNKSKLLHYHSKGNWSDNLNNYGKFKCKGTILMNQTVKGVIKSSLFVSWKM